MLDFILDYLLFPIFGILIIGICFALYMAANEQSKEFNRLVTQCMADGKKEYECVSILRRPNDNTVVIPMPVVVH